MTQTACKPPPPAECLAATCGHGRPTLWNIVQMRWEIPGSGPCCHYRLLPDPVPV